MDLLENRENLLLGNILDVLGIFGIPSEFRKNPVITAMFIFLEADSEQIVQVELVVFPGELIEDHKAIMC